MSSPTETPIVVGSTANAPPAPVTTSAPSYDSVNVGIRDGITTVMAFARKTFEEILKPSINSFIETSQTNPRVAAIAGTPALLAYFFTVAFLVFSTLTLVIWTLITVAFGIVFVVIGGLKGLLLKLIFVVVASIPLAAVGTGLLICGNSLAQFIIKQIPSSLNLGAGASSPDEVDWQKVAEALLRNAIQWSRYTVPVAHTIFETSKVIIQAFYASLRTTAVLMHDVAGSTRDDPTPSPPNATSENSASTALRPADSVAVPQGDSDNELIIVEPVNISTASELTPTLHQRAPFRHTNDGEGN